MRAKKNKDILESIAERIYGRVHYGCLQQAAKAEVASDSSAIPGVTKRIVPVSRYDRLFRIPRLETPVAGYVVAYPVVEIAGQERQERKSNVLLKYFVETDSAFYKYSEIASFESEDIPEEGVKRNISDFQHRFSKRTGLEARVIELK